MEGKCTALEIIYLLVRRELAIGTRKGVHLLTVMLVLGLYAIT